MAVSYKITVHQTLYRAGLPESVANKLHEKGMQTVLSLNRLRFVVNGEVIRSIPLTDKTALLLGNGGIVFRPAMQKHLRSKLEPLLPELLAAVEHLPVVNAPLSAAALADLNAPPDEAPVAAPSAAPAVSVGGTFGSAPCSEADMATLARVPLTQATRLYQPVNASSKNSRYFVVAIGGGLFVAARHLNGTLSVRVEGDLATHAKRLQQVGLNCSAGYSSVHLACADAVVASKALGAILLGMEVPFSTPNPQLGRLTGKGA